MAALFQGFRDAAGHKIQPLRRYSELISVSQAQDGFRFAYTVLEYTRVIGYTRVSLTLNCHAERSEASQTIRS